MIISIMAVVVMMLMMIRIMVIAAVIIMKPKMIMMMIIVIAMIRQWMIELLYIHALTVFRLKHFATCFFKFRVSMTVHKVY